MGSVTIYGRGVCGDMLLNELTAYFEEEFSYPVECETVLEQAGDVQIEAPDDSDTQTVASILEPLGYEEFDSAEALYEAVYGNVDDAYIGRKYYDDRGGEHGDAEDQPRDDENNVSF